MELFYFYALFYSNLSSNNFNFKSIDEEVDATKSLLESAAEDVSDAVDDLGGGEML